MSQPEFNEKDFFYKLLRIVVILSATGLSTISPFPLLAAVGVATVSELASLIKAPLERRTEAWLKSLEDGLQEVKLSIKNLHENEQFITMVVNAIQIVIRNHRVEKLSALRNVVINTTKLSAEGEWIDEWGIVFLNWIDTLTVSHLQLLVFLNDPKNKKVRLFSQENPEWKAIDIQLIKDLETLGLIDMNQKSSGVRAVQRNLDRSALKSRQTEKILEDVWEAVNYGDMKRDKELDSFLVTIKNGYAKSCTTELGRFFISFMEFPLEKP